MSLPKPAAAAGKVETVAIDPPYDLEKFCYYTFSHCRTYILEAGARKSFSSQSGIRFVPRDVVVLYPTAYGGGQEIIPFKKNAEKREEAIEIIEMGLSPI